MPADSEPGAGRVNNAGGRVIPIVATMGVTEHLNQASPADRPGALIFCQCFIIPNHTDSTRETFQVIDIKACNNIIFIDEVIFAKPFGVRSAPVLVESGCLLL